MVKYDSVNVEKQNKVLSSILNDDIGDEYEAQKIIYNKLKEIKDEIKCDNLNINVFVNDTNKSTWKSGSSKPNLFSKIFNNEITYATNKYKLTRTEIGFLYSLSPFLLWEKNLLVDNEGLPINQKRLMELLGLSRSTVSNTIKSLENKKCIIRIFTGINKQCYYIVNPYLMCNGKSINKDIPKLFTLIGYIPMSKCKDK